MEEKQTSLGIMWITWILCGTELTSFRYRIFKKSIFQVPCREVTWGRNKFFFQY
jgi:hypothetical protein